MELIIIKTILLAILPFSSLGVQLDNPEYYWRDHPGYVPRDAFPSGYDVNKGTTYIGQTHVVDPNYPDDYQLIVGSLYPNYGHMPKLVVSINGTIKERYYAKVLCTTQPNALKWMPATKEDFWFKIRNIEQMNNMLIVMGGYDTQNDHVIFIGRTKFQGELIVGKIISQNEEVKTSNSITILRKAVLSFVSNNTEYKATSYDVLIYVPVYFKKDIHAQSQPCSVKDGFYSDYRCL